jgi:hypothetical protein
MANLFAEGDVVECLFPYQEDPTKFKKRPGLILKVEYNGQIPIFITAKITTTDNSSYIVGKVIPARSREGRQMRFTDDSFIHLENIARLPRFAIKRRLGTCPCMSEIFKICTDNKIAF